MPFIPPDDYYVGLHGGDHSFLQAAFVLTPENHEINNITIAAVQGSEHTLNLGNLHQAPQAAFVLTPENHEIDPAIDVEHPPAELISAI